MHVPVLFIFQRLAPHPFLKLRFCRQYAMRSTIHAKMELGALVYGNSDDPTKKAEIAAALKFLSVCTGTFTRV